MYWRGLAVAALLLLVSACVFQSSTPLFTEREAATPFADGARFLWREHSGDETETVVYRRVGDGYEIRALGEPDDEVMRALFIPIHDTAEEDYIAQVQMDAGEPGRVYAFLWRTGEGFRIVAAPSVARASSTGEGATERHCVEAPNGECRLVTQANVLGVYRAVHAFYVVGSATPADYIDQTPLTATTRLGKS